MKNLLVPAMLAVLCLFSSCVIEPECEKVTGPRDINCKIIENPACFSGCSVYSTEGIWLINSDYDLDYMCPGCTAPASWDLTAKSYIVVTAGHTAQNPYIAGVGTDPVDSGRILVTVGRPCNTGMTPMVYVYKTFTLETGRTVRELRLEVIDEMP